MASKNRDNMYLKLVELQVAIDKKVDQNYIERILQNGLDVNYTAPLHLLGKYKVGGMTALHLAQYERRIDISKQLLFYGVDFTLKNSMGSTALHAAMERAYEYENYTVAPLLESTHEFANLILSAHIQSKNFNNPCNYNGISHFHAACTVNNVEAVRFFLDNGVSVDQQIHVDSPFLSGYTALHVAVKYYSLEVVAVLLEYNANMTAKNSKGLNPLHMCVNQKIEWCNYTLHRSTNECLKNRLETSDQILHLMLKKYSPIDDVGLSHVHIACVLANSSFASHLLEQSVNIDHMLNHNSPIYAGYTALHFAAQCSIDAVKLLVTKGADVHLRDSKGRSPLDLFLQKFSIKEMHSILLCHPVWKDILLVDNKTKLLDLIDVLGSSAAFDLVERNFGSNINLPLIPSNSPLWPGYTLLHLVMSLTNDAFHLIHECSKRGADATTQDSFGSTPLHVATEKYAYISWKIFINLWESCSKIANSVNQNNLSHLHILSTDEYLYGPLQCLRDTKNSNVMKAILLKDQEMEIQSHIPYRGRTITGIVTGSTPLHLAVTDAKKTKLLMEYGADINAVDIQGFTPIHRLIKTERDGGKKAGAILFATPDLKDCVVSSIELSYLHVASHLDDVESVKKFLDLGTDINLRISPRLPAYCSFLEKYAGYTPLQIAVSNNSKGIVKFLLRHGADMFTKKDADDPPLIYEILNRKKDDHFTAFVDTLENNYALRKRFNEETGLTMFHVACHKLDVDSMKQYLQNQGATVNARAHADSPIWPGLTALHIFRDGMRLLRLDDNDHYRFISVEDKLRNDNILDDVLDFLLKNGADVTIADNNGNTPIHLFFKKMESSFTDYVRITTCYNTTDSNSQKIESTCKNDYGRVSRLLKVQKDFSINPTDSEGTSHFHIACRMNDFAIVKKFCKHGGVDINKPNHHGDTPLHLSVRSPMVKYSGSAAQVKTIDCLLKQGAELDIQNNIGNTPLHEAVYHAIADVKVFEKLFKAGADPKVENVYRSTPFELLCTSRNSSMKHFKLFVKRGCQFNVFNSMSNEGFVGLILSNENPNWESILKYVLSLPEAKATDIMGRSFIHNVVSTKWITVDEYRKIIQQLSNLGCDIDSQDKGGETALHRAMKLSNCTAVSALIEAGADVSVAGINGKTDFESRCRSWTSTVDSNENGIKSILLRHLAILDYCELPMCQIIKDIIKDYQHEYSERFFQEMSKAEYEKIGDSLTLRRFLSGETICAYPYTSLANRNAIRAFVESIDNSEYQELKPFIRLVFRQGEKRVGLIGDASSSLQMLLGSPVPDVCSRIIFGCLKNADLENLITAALEDLK